MLNKDILSKFKDHPGKIDITIKKKPVGEKDFKASNEMQVNLKSTIRQGHKDFNVFRNECIKKMTKKDKLEI